MRSDSYFVLLIVCIGLYCFILQNSFSAYFPWQPILGKVECVQLYTYRFVKACWMFTYFLHDFSVGNYRLQNSFRGKEGIARGLGTQISMFSTGQRKQHNTVPAIKSPGVNLNNYLSFYIGLRIFQNKMHVVLLSI